jgi:hypothetical protein
VTAAVLAYVALRLLITSDLMITGWPAPDLPIALLGLLALDLPAAWGPARWPLAGLATTALLLGASAAGLSSVGVGSSLTAAAIVAPLLLLALLATLSRRGRRPASITAGLLLALPLLTLSPPTPPPAWAHDPGQGDELATAQLTARGNGDRWDVELADIQKRSSSPAGLVPVRLLARRAGTTQTAPLTATAGGFAGTITLPAPGRWFVYAELRMGDRLVETWVPVRNGGTATITDRRSLYAPAGGGQRPAGEYVAGAILLAISAALLAWAATAVRRSRHAAAQ